MKEPGLKEVLLLTALTYACFIGFILIFKSYSEAILGFGDSGSYIQIAAAIRHWDFQGIAVKHFWGLPYLVATVSGLARVREIEALIAVSVAASVVSVILAYKIWGGWVAAFFSLLNFPWIQFTLLGGSEPLFMALLLGAWMLFRRKRYVWAVILSSLATVVRPVGILAVISFGIVMLFRREYGQLAISTLASVAIAVCYVMPFWLYFGDPLANMHTYQSLDWSGALVSWPFLAILAGSGHAPITNLLLNWGWILFVCFGSWAYLRKSEASAERLFVALYVAFLFTYNSPRWAYADFVRFAIPIVPFTVVGLKDWLPTRQAVLVSLSVVSGVLAAASAVGIRNVLH